MVCKKCGYENDDSCCFCIMCGEELGGTLMQEAGTGKPKVHKGVVLAAVLAVAAAAAVMAVVAVNNAHKESRTLDDYRNDILEFARPYMQEDDGQDGSGDGSGQDGSGDGLDGGETDAPGGITGVEIIRK